MNTAPLTPAELLAFEHCCALSRFTAEQGIAILVRRQLAKKKGEEPAVRPEEAGPAPLSVEVTISVTLPIPPAEAPSEDLLSLVREHLRPVLGPDWDITSRAITAAAFGDEVLRLYVASPYWLHDLPPRLNPVLCPFAKAALGEGVTVAWFLSPEYAAQAGQAEQEAQERARLAALEYEARAVTRAKILELYNTKTAAAAQEADLLTQQDPEVWHLMRTFERKQIETWLSATLAGSAYQTGKEAAYQGPKGKGTI